MNIACYDNGGKTFDRYTVIFLNDRNPRNGLFAALGMSDDPFHPQGFSQHTEAMRGKHLGKRIAFSDLPEKCQGLVKADLAAYGPFATYKR